MCVCICLSCWTGGECVCVCLPQERQRMKEFLLTIVLEGLEEKHNMLLSRGTYNISTHFS